MVNVPWKPYLLIGYPDNLFPILCFLKLAYSFNIIQLEFLDVFELELATIDLGELPAEVPTSEQPSWEATSSRPTYLPPFSTTTDSVIDIDDAIQVEAGDTPPMVAAPEDCHGRLFIPHKRDCSKYYLCNFGRVTEHSCPPGLYWNEDRCDWPENTKCKESQLKVRLLH